MTDVLLGTTVEVSSIDGPKRVKIPPGHLKVRLRGLGAPDVDKGGSGDLYVEVKIDLPGKLTETQKQIVETLKKEGL